MSTECKPPWEPLDTMCNCRRCGKPICEMPAKDAYCCECRYGKMAEKARQEVEPDCVEWQRKGIGYRIANWMRRLW